MTRRGVTFKTWFTIQEPSKLAEDYDDDPASWVDKYALLKGNLIPATGREFVAGQRVEESVTHVIQMRFVPDLLASMRVILIAGDRVLNINSIIDVQGKGRDLLLSCTEVIK